MNPWEAYKQEREAQGQEAILKWKTEANPTAKTAESTNATNPWEAYKQEREAQGKAAVPAWTAAARPTTSAKGVPTTINPLTGKRMPAFGTSKDPNDQKGFQAKLTQQRAQETAQKILEQGKPYRDAEKAYREGRNVETVSKDIEELKVRRDQFVNDYGDVKTQATEILDGRVEFDGDADTMAQITFLTTVLSIITIPVAAALFM